MAYRAYHLLDAERISLGDLVEFAGWSRTTWSRFLRGRLDPEPAGIRKRFEDFLRERGIAVPATLWTRGESEPDAATPDPSTDGELVMRGQSLTENARAHFKLFRAPFEPEAMEGGDRLAQLYLPASHKFVELRLVQAFTSAGFVAVYGEPGSGKSTLCDLAFRRAVERKPVVRVAPPNVERRRMTAMHIAAEIIRQLSEESVPRTANVRDAVATQVLKQRYAQGQRVALVIDEAHELPDTTLKDLKRFHEMADGYIRLLAIVLVGQTELANRFELERNHRLREAIIRCQLVHLPPLRNAGEVRAYMATRFGWVGADLDAAWETDAVDELERRLAPHDQQIPVLIGNIATAAMNVAYLRGNPKVTADEVIDVAAANIEQLRQWGLA